MAKILKKQKPKSVKKSKAKIKKVAKKTPAKLAKKPVSVSKKSKSSPKTKKSIKKILNKPAKKLIKKISKKKVPKKLSKLKKSIDGIKLQKDQYNPILKPRNYNWESEAVFNPAVVQTGDGRIHLFYRALGPDGLSRIGYAASRDGVNLCERLPYPIYVAEDISAAQKYHHPFTSPARLVYNPVIYESGGGWGGCEDPRAVNIDGQIYMTFNMFNGWHSMRVAYTSISESDLKNRRWNWTPLTYLSHPGDRQKNWVLFPEKINGKFALFHNLDKGDPSRVHIKYLDKLEMSQAPSSQEALDPQLLPDHNVAWHYRTRSASAPPVKTEKGWILLYHAMDRSDPNRYKVGVLLLDLEDPTKVLHRSSLPVLEPDEWYENEGKPGIVYATGAIVKNGVLFVYYGGGDKFVCVASIPVDELLEDLQKDKQPKLKTKSGNK